MRFLQLAAKDKDDQLSQSETRREALKQQIKDTQRNWKKFTQKCTCASGKKYKRDADDTSNTSTGKVKNVANVFFMSPVKPARQQCDGNADDVVLAPLSEEYLTEHVDASTPVTENENKHPQGRSELI